MNLNLILWWQILCLEWGDKTYSDGVADVISFFDWGYTGDVAQGRVFILHDYDGARIACAVIAENTLGSGSFGSTNINTYPGYPLTDVDPVDPKGAFALSIVDTTAYISYNFM